MLESKIEQITRELENPDLYTAPNGVDRANALGGELNELKPALERALESWGTASELLDTLMAERT